MYCIHSWLEVRTLIFDQRTFPVPRSTCSWRVTTYVDKPSAIGQPSRPTQPFIFPRSINWVVSYIGCVLPRSGGECLWSKLTMVVWVAGENCDPVNTCHSVALRDCLGHKTALYKYLILYFTFTLQYILKYFCWLCRKKAFTHDCHLSRVWNN